MRERFYRSGLSAKRHARGFSLIELMVGITIALIVTLAIFSVLSVSESRKRSTTAVNDINQSGAYSAYLLDRAIRSAGSGFANQHYTLKAPPADVEGCPLSLVRDTVQIAPSLEPYPAPFAAMTQTPVLAPVIIDPGTGGASDVITVMSGMQGKSEVGPKVIAPSVNGVAVENTFSFNPGDLVLFGHNANESPCPIAQVDASFLPAALPTTNAPDQNLPLSNTLAPAAGTANLAKSFALGIGDTTNNPPQFKMYGVRADRTLVALDLLNISGAAMADRAVPVADGVIEMHAVYGIDTDASTPMTINSWVRPTNDAADEWSPGRLRDRSAASSANLRRIVAVHIALVMRTSLEERDDVQAGTSFTLFSGLLPAGLPTLNVTYNGGAPDRYRYRVIETTIPLRNNLGL